MLRLVLNEMLFLVAFQLIRLADLSGRKNLQMCDSEVSLAFNCRRFDAFSVGRYGAKRFCDRAEANIIDSRFIDNAVL